ncbi:MAG: hypothetical protein IAA16_02485 [Candidatus Treponema excrementipullorum]|uniref:Lipoprotein n=1 Tax=Candidatus Treponema excrementipullorum TaxID=2838768 RepID=A0A9E2L0R1_9SPIR|nr:hypothetical protein [Candidatus Treponema excrementipullorum]
MKRMIIAFAVTVVLVLLAMSCTTTSETAAVAVPQAIDWQGAEFGDPIPDWVRAVANRDYELLSNLPEMNGKVAMAFSGEGQDRDLLEIWVDTNDASAQMVRQIQQTVTNTAGTLASGNKDNSESARKMAESVTGIWSQASISGFAKMRDFWTQVQLADGSTEYRYYTLYGIDKENLEYQIDTVMGKIKAETEAEEEVLIKIEDAIKESAFAATGSVERI